MTSIATVNTNFLALVTAASLMTSEAALPTGTTSSPRKNRMLMDSSLSVVSHSDNDDEEGSNGNKLMTSDGTLTDSSEPLSDDDLTPYDQPKAPPPIIQPEAPPPAPPPPPPAVDNFNRTNTNCGSAGGSVSSGTSNSDGSSSGSNSSPPSDVGVYRVYHNNKPQSLPITLMNLLTSEECDEILSFLPHGKCFIIKQTKEFAKKLMQQHFHLSKFGSFVSRLQRWGFAHLQDSILPGQHAFYHPLFEKGKWDPLGKMMYQPKSTKAFKNKLTKSMASRAGLNHSLRRNSIGVSGAAMGGSLKDSLVRLHSSNSAHTQHAQLLGRDLALVSQSTVNHATQNIVDAAIACLRRDEELLSVPRLAVPKNTNTAPVVAAVAPSRKKAVSFHNHNHNQHNNAPTRRSMVEPLPPLPPVPTNRNRNVNVGPPPPRHSMGVMSPMRNIARRVSVSPTVYADGLLRSATSQMMLWQQTQQHQAQVQVQQQVRQPHQHQPAPTMVNRPVVNRHQPLPPHQMGGQQHCNSSRSAFVVPGGGGLGGARSGVGSPMDSFRRDMYLPNKHQHRGQEELLVMPQHRQARSFVPVNSFYM